MKYILFLLLISSAVKSQTLYIPSNPDSLKLPVNVNNAVRSVYVTDLTKTLRALVNSKVDTTTTFTIRNAKATGITTGDTIVLIKPNRELIFKRLIPSTGIVFNVTDTSIMLSVDSSKYNTKRYSDSAFASKSSAAGSISRVLVSNVQVINTGNTNEDTVYAGTIPANSIGVNGSFHIHWLTKAVGSTTFKVRLNGVQLGVFTGATGTAQKNETIISNRNSLTSQVSLSNQSSASTSFGNGTAGGISTYTIDMSQPVRFTVTIQNAAGTDTPSLEAVEVLAVY